MSMRGLLSIVAVVNWAFIGIASAGSPPDSKVNPATGNIETVAVLHNFRLAAARARADYGQAVAALEAVIGRPLTRTERGSK